MKQHLLLALCVIFSISSFGQNKEGGYATLTDFQNNTPNYLDTFVVSQRTIMDIKAWGGNDYKVESLTKTTAKKVIKKQIWGFYINNTLYLNGIGLTGLSGYSKVEMFGKYCFLKPAFPVSQKIQKELGIKNDPQYGYMFGAIGGAIQGAEMAVKRIPLIYCILDGQKMLLNKKNVLTLLENQSELKSNFLAEENQESQDILLKYLKLLNISLQ